MDLINFFLVASSIFAVGLTNAIIFAPASEHVYFILYLNYGPSSLWSLWFSLTNSLGHILVFQACRGIRKQQILGSKHGRFERLIRKADSYLDSEFYKRDRQFYSVALLRCVPFFHSAISIIASLTRISLTRLIIFTLLGNILFAIILNWMFFTFNIPRGMSASVILIGLISISILSYTIHKCVVMIINKQLH